ncbi:MAG: SAM-dependent methyltransferase [Hymenobacteraceae bacterium]|nr:SAM-dependent methyltransferase [Hymenobacteraceae bacterium]
MPATLYLIPTVLTGEDFSTAAAVLPAAVPARIAALRLFFVENVRTARRFIKAVTPAAVIDDLTIELIDKDASADTVRRAIQRVAAGQDAGVLSEAGCPGIADPGAALAAEAHRQGVRVVPLTGPSSLLLALMGSGMNGQQFAFLGYLPVERAARQAAIKKLEQQAQRASQTQLFIETPYRNQALLTDLLATLQPATRLCVACDLTAETELLVTKTVADWRKTEPPALHKRPAGFVVGG